MAKIITTPQQFSKQVKRGVYLEFSREANRIKNKILSNINLLLPVWISESPEIQSLSHGPLRGEIGLTDYNASVAVNGILAASSKITTVDLKKNQGKSFGRLVVSIAPLDHAQFLSLPGSTYLTAKGVEIPWLKTLLFDGSKVIVSEYEYIAAKGEGRSGLGRMKKGGFWRIPPQYAGTSQDNFITRSILRNFKTIENIVIKATRND